MTPETIRNAKKPLFQAYEIEARDEQCEQAGWELLARVFTPPLNKEYVYKDDTRNVIHGCRLPGVLGRAPPPAMMAPAPRHQHPPWRAVRRRPCPALPPSRPCPPP